DWVPRSDVTGHGVIDTTGAAAHIAALSGNNNHSFIQNMSQSALYIDPNSGKQWIDAKFIRDRNSAGNNLDNSVFGGGSDKNADNPKHWTAKIGSIPQKNDLIDVMAHVRRDVGAPSD